MKLKYQTYIRGGFKMLEDMNLTQLFENAPQMAFVVSDGIAPQGYTLTGNLCISNAILHMDCRMLYIMKFIVDNVIASHIIDGLDSSSIFSITGFDNITRFKIESMNEDETLHTIIVYNNGELIVTKA